MGLRGCVFRAADGGEASLFFSKIRNSPVKLLQFIF
jgi:hypothetical protein